MVNINAHLPNSVAAAFHPPTENLQRDNSIKPVIPKTEIISSYTKLRDQNSGSQVSDSAHSIVQDDGKQEADQASHRESSAEKRRSYFFALRGQDLVSTTESTDSQLNAIKDFKKIVSVIQARYDKAVRPLPDPLINCAV